MAKQLTKNQKWFLIMGGAVAVGLVVFLVSRRANATENASTDTVSPTGSSGKTSTKQTGGATPQDMTSTVLGTMGYPDWADPNAYSK